MIGTSLRVETKKVVRKHVTTNLMQTRWSLPVILLFQAVTSLVALHNTAFQDEALYLLAGRQIFHSWTGGPPVIDPYGQYFSGYPYFYPVIGGVLDSIGGLELARFFSLLCMVGVSACVYYIAKTIFDRNSALYASAFFACQGPVLFLCRLATYDALCLLMIALAATLAVYVSTANKPWAALGIGPILVLAVAAKYAGLLFVPTVLILLVWYSLERRGLQGTLARLGLTLFSLAAVAIIAYLKLDKSTLAGLSSTTTNRVAIVSNPPIVLLRHIISLGGPAYGLAALGLVLSVIFIGKYRLPLAALLFVSSFLAPAYHLYKGELVSLDKHLAFSVFFIMPLVGFAIATVAGYQLRRSTGRYWFTGLAICLIMFMLGTQQAQSNYSEWATSTDLTYVFHTQVRLGSGRYLAEEYDVSRYYLQDVTYSWQWNSLDFFTYTDKAHHHLVGPAAYQAAIQDGYFDLVELNYGYNAALATTIDANLKASGKYELIEKLPYQNAFGRGYYWVWRKRVTPATNS